jgi:hypothetical protein
MTQTTGRSRTGLLAVVALVVVVHGLALERLAGALSSGTESAAPPPPEPGQVRLVQLLPVVWVMPDRRPRGAPGRR